MTLFAAHALHMLAPAGAKEEPLSSDGETEDEAGQAEQQHEEEHPHAGDNVEDGEAAENPDTALAEDVEAEITQLLMARDSEWIAMLIDRLGEEDAMDYIREHQQEANLDPHNDARYLCRMADKGWHHILTTILLEHYNDQVNKEVCAHAFEEYNVELMVHYNQHHDYDWYRDVNNICFERDWPQAIIDILSAVEDFDDVVIEDIYNRALGMEGSKWDRLRNYMQNRYFL